MSTFIAKLIICAMIVSPAMAAIQIVPIAIEQFQIYQAALAKDVQKQDWVACLVDAKQLQTFLKVESRDQKGRLAIR